MAVLNEEVAHKFPADTLSLALVSYADAHQIAASIHLQEASITNDGERVALSSDNYFVAGGLPETFKDEYLLVQFAEGFLVHHQDEREYFGLSLLVLSDFFDD